MKNKQKIILIVCIIAVIVGVSSFFIFRKNKKNAYNEETSLRAGKWRDDSFPLSQGSSGMNVQMLQGKMNLYMALRWDTLTDKPKHQYGADAGLPMKEIEVDGKFGTNTREFVKFIFGKDTLSESEFNSFNPAS